MDFENDQLQLSSLYKRREIHETRHSQQAYAFLTLGIEATKTIQNNYFTENLKNTYINLKWSFKQSEDIYYKSNDMGLNFQALNIEKYDLDTRSVIPCVI